MGSDFRVIDGGSLIGLKPITVAASTWADENLVTEGWQIMGGVIWCDPRMALPIIDGILADGLSITEVEHA